MKSLSRIPLALSCFVLGTLPLAAASVVYSNGLPNQQSGEEMTHWMHGDDIQVTTPITFDTIRFWNLEVTGGASYNGSVVWLINQDNPGFPAVATVGSAPATPARTLIQSITSGTWAGFDEYQNDISLSVPITLTAGTYWLVLHNRGYSFDSDQNFYWETTDNNGTSNSYNFVRTGMPPGPWIINNNLSAPVAEAQLAYQLLDSGASTPEPGTLIMIAAGFALIAGSRRSRRP